MRNIERFGRGIVLASVAAGLLFGSACAGSNESSEPAFDTEPNAPTPHLRHSWRKKLETPSVADYRPSQFADPAVERATNHRDVFVGTDSGYLYRLRAGNGKVQWEVELDGPIHAEPLPDDNRVYVGTTHGTFYAVDRSSGSIAWKISNEREIESRAAASDGLVFYTTNAGRLVAIDASKGERAWSYSRSIPKEFTIKGSGTPVVEGHTVYCGFADGRVAALKTRSGEKKWIANVTDGATDFTDVDDPVMVRDDRVYVASYGAGIAALQRKDGTTVWRRNFENVASVAYGEGRIYLAVASGRILALRAEDGVPAWGFSMKENLPVAVVPTAAYLFVSTSNGPLYILDRSTGYPLRKWKPSTGFNTAVAFSERAGFLLSNRGYLYRFRLAY